ncbi:MAG: zinc ABC transporter substrate-binding protein [Phycisphaerae bacterium]
MRRYALMIQTVLIVMLAAVAGLLPACQRAESNGKPTAVATIFCYYDALRSIGGDKINAVLLLPPRTSPHEYEPPVQAKSQVQSAKLIISNGLGLDPWIDKLAAGNDRAILLKISAKIPVALLHTAETSLDDPAATQATGDAKHEQEDFTQGNPHIWLDPTVQIAAAEQIRDALAQIDPPNQAYYATQAAAYIKEIQTLDDDIKQAATGFTRKEFIGFHSAYDYLAHRYGLKQIAALEEYPEQGITKGQAERVINLIREKNIKVIFTENALPSKDADLIVRQTGVKLGVLQPLETYDDPKDTYVSLMRQNLENLKQALGQ